MMLPRFIVIAAAILLVWISGGVSAEKAREDSPEDDSAETVQKNLQPGDIAPAFTLTGVAGRERSLSDFHDRLVVLEWVDFTCTESNRLYDQKVVPQMQAEYREKGVVWLSINVASKGREGWLENRELRLKLAKIGSRAADCLVDPNGTVAEAYHISTCPAVFVISPDGHLLYSGAISEETNQSAEGKSQTREYLRLALDAALEGSQIQIASSQFHGCQIDR